MSLSVYESSVPVFVSHLKNMQAWFDKALAEGKDEKTLVEARLAPDMFPFSRQIQIASDAAKGAGARLTGTDAPSMPDTETTFAELKARLQKTIDYLESLDPKAFEGGADREVIIKFPNGGGYRFDGRTYLQGFALPNFFFHVTAAYAILRNNGVAMGKPDFLAHLGMPNL